MKNILFKISKLIIGFFLFALGIVMTINANLGVSPWDVFHQGLSLSINITLGQANIFVGFIIVLLDIYLGQNIGWASLLNMILIGVFIDILMLNNLVPAFNSFLPNFIMLILGVLIQGYGCWIYLTACMGAGPRDGLMVVLTKKTGKSVRFIKSIIEVGAVSVGFVLGGKLGVGTLIMALLGGQIFQFAFKTVRFDVKSVEHRFIKDDFIYIKEKFNLVKTKNPS